MPIYEYQCDACGAQRELILKPGEVARPTCTSCRRRMRRVISKTAFILKGTGWYVTDYPSDARKKGMEGEKPTAAAVADAGTKKEAAGVEKKAGSAEKKPAPAPSGGHGKSDSKKKK